MTAEQIEREAFTLSQVERCALAAKLVASLDDPGAKLVESEPVLTSEDQEDFHQNRPLSVFEIPENGQRH